MKWGIAFQIVITLLLLTFVILGNSKFTEYMMAKEVEFESYFMIIESDDNDFLEGLKAKLDSVEVIKKVELQSPEFRTKEMQKKFKESFPKNVVSQLEVPGQLAITFDYPEVFKVNFSELQREFMLQIDSLVYFDDEMYQNAQNNYLTIISLFNYVFWGFLVFAFFLLIRIRVYFEKRYNNFWEVLHRAGGDVSERKKTYWQTTFIMIISVIISILIYLYYLHPDFQISLFEIKFTVATTVYLFFVNLFSKLFMWKQKW